VHEQQNYFILDHLSRLFEHGDVAVLSRSAIIKTKINLDIRKPINLST